jgi:hypothetical protein
MERSEEARCSMFLKVSLNPVMIKAVLLENGPESCVWDRLEGGVEERLMARQGWWHVTLAVWKL